MGTLILFAVYVFVSLIVIALLHAQVDSERAAKAVSEQRLRVSIATCEVALKELKALKDAQHVEHLEPWPYGEEVPCTD